jgi:two-component system sensor histidine kinase ChvG
MKRPLRPFSRLPLRLLAFNLLLVFLPIVGVLFLGEYERRLETAEVRAMTEQARLVAASVALRGTLDAAAFEELVVRAKLNDVRMRLVDWKGSVVADSQQLVAPASRPPRTDRHNVLYRVGAFLLRPVVRMFRPPEAGLTVDFYENAARLAGPEVLAALRHGEEGLEKKITGDQRSVTFYRTVPVVVGGWTVGAVVASKSTYTILQDLYAVRLRVMRIFVASLLVAILVSLFFRATVVKPLRQLRVDARAVLDRRNRIRGHFKGSKRLDEIGELSRALERIMRRLDAHVKFIETFAADVVHELKNPLASIRNASEMIADVDPADRLRFVHIIEQEVARMERLLSGVREISLIDAELVREEPVATDVATLLHDIVDGFRAREGSRLRFELQTDGESLLVDASRDRLLQVFENLLDNSASFSPPGGTVAVQAVRDNGSVVVRVSDQGPGIPESNLGRIFDRFFTHRPAASRRDGHTGLGLAIVKTIVEAYGGNVGAVNAERGAVFSVRLPASRT